MHPQPYDEAPLFTVSSLSRLVRSTLEETFSLVRVRGEISGFKAASSGHLYMTLKDETSALDAVCWKPLAARLPLMPEDGVEVMASGKMTAYGARSKYQLVITWLAYAGEGALLQRIERLKRTLAAEGLFAAERKKALPFLPKRIGVITSPTGAVVHDIRHRLEERFPCHMILWPVLVQGPQAARDIVRAVQGFNAHPYPPDLLIIARGGGSLEDLAPFQEEALVRAVAESHLPVISAVGHETDTTLVDFAADVRAPTPTAAAEYAVPERSSLLSRVEKNGQRLESWKHRLLRHTKAQMSLFRRLPQKDLFLGAYMQPLDEISSRLGFVRLNLMKEGQAQLKRYERLGFALKSFVVTAERELSSLEKRWHTTFHVTRSRYWTATASRRLDQRFARLRATLHESSQLTHLGERLLSLSYKNTLKRGYVVVRSESGLPLTRVSDLRVPSTVLSLEFTDGRAYGALTDIKKGEGEE